MDLWIRIAYFSDAFSLFVFFGFSVHLSPPPFSSTNSEEAKSTTWLHPVTGEAVITGHRKTPGKQSENGVLFSPCQKTCAHAAPAKGYPRVTAEEKKEKKGRQVAERAVEGNEGEISSLCSKATASSAPLPFLLPSGRPLRTAFPPPPTHLLMLHLDTLRHTF